MPRLTDARLNEILDCGRVAYVVYGRNGRVEYCNTLFAEWFLPGLATDDIVGLELHALFDIVDGRNIVMSCNGNPDWRAETLKQRENPGTFCEFRLTNGMILQGREQKLAGGRRLSVLTDVTEMMASAAAQVESEWRCRDRFESAVEATRRSEERLRDFATLSADSLWETDCEQRFVFCEGSLWERVGLDPRAAVGRRRPELFASCTIDPRVFERLESLMNRGESIRGLEVGYHCGEEIVWALLNAKPLHDETGNLVGYRGVGRDITEAKRSRQELARTHAQLESAARMALLGYFVRDDDGDRCIFCSSTMAELLGIESQAYVGRSLAELEIFVHPEDWPSYMETLKDYATGGDAYSVDYRILRKDGVVRHVRELGRRTQSPGGAMTWTIGTVQDITADRRRQIELDHTKRLLQDQINSSPVAIIGYDREGRVISWNPAAQALYGWTGQEVVGQLPRHVPSEALEEFFRILNRVLSGQRITQIETGRQRRDGTSVDIQADIGPVYDAHDEVMGAIAIVNDMTERNRLLAELKEQEQLVQHAQRLQTVSTLAGGIAHSFNNMLLPIMMLTENIIEGSEEGSRIRNDAVAILETAERAASLVRLILDFGGRKQPRNESCDVSGAVEEALPLVETLLRGDITLQTSIDCNVGAVRLDKPQLVQLLLNLVGNAVEAMEGQGRIFLTLSAVANDGLSVVGLGHLAQGRYARIRVSDEGGGIDPSVLPRIFDPFFSTKEVGEGTGLGLSIVHGIVTACAGAIEVGNAPGVGSTFDVYLPLMDRGFAVTEKEGQAETTAS